MRKFLLVLTIVSVLATLTGGAAAQDVPNPAITITSPTWGAVVSNEGTITVTGIATNLFEGGLAVQALAADGTILAQVAVTAPGAALGGTGTWSAELEISTAANTAGRIYAFSTSAQDGSLEAQASVEVTFGAVLQSGITITIPAEGAILNTAGGLIVTGTSLNIAENQFTLQARTAEGTVLAQTSVPTNTTGTWQTTLNPLLVANTPGTVYAFAQNTAGVYASATVNVTFQANCALRTDWPTYQVQVGDNLFRIAQSVGSTMDELRVANCLINPSVIVVGQNIYVPRLPTPEPGDTDTGDTGGDGDTTGTPGIAITSPEQGASVAAGATLTVTGTGGLLFEGNVLVRLLDDQGGVLAENFTTLANVKMDGTGTWQLDLPVTEIQSKRGTIFAYSGGGRGGEIIVSDAVNVTFGTSPAGEASVTITSPIPYANTGGTTFTVSGMAASLPEGGLVVEARDHGGRLLAQRLVQTTTDQWTTQITVNVAAGTHGTIIVYALSPLNEMGTFVSYTSRNVVFGTGSTSQPFATIEYPLPGEQLFGAVGGKAGGIPEGASVLVEALDAESTVLDMQIAQVETDGMWFADLNSNLLTLSGPGSVVVYFADPATGAILAYDRVPVHFGQ